MRRVVFAFMCLAVFAVSARSAPVFAQEKSEAPKKESPAASELTWGHIEMKGGYPEGSQMPGLFGDLTESLTDAIARLDKAAADSKVSGLILRIDNPSLGMARVNTLRAAIARVREKGKRVVAYMDEASNASYLLASACDEIVMPEPSVLMTVGLRAEVSFYKNLFDMVGLKAEMLRVGEYKSAAEPFSRNSMSPEFRKEMEEILDDRYRQMIETIAKSRKLTPEKVIDAIDAGPLSAAQAKELGLIDRIGYETDIESGLEKLAEGKSVKLVRKFGKKKVDNDFSGLTGMMKMMDMLMGVEQPKRKTTNPKLALIYASGPIMTGKSSADFLTGEATIGSETMVKAIREARQDDTVKAIVMRVDSPGGSALASDLIWHELELVKKPFVVSMGDVAGSGGYYIAMGADKIFADPGTITGSIGVVGGKIALEGVYSKIGINTEVISRGKNAGIFSSTTPFTDSERETMQKMLNTIYDQFVSKAAQGRKMDKDKLEKLARGRIYTGQAARKLGLVDELGSLDDAIAAAVKLAGLKPEDKLERMILPKAVSPFESLFGTLDAGASVGSRDLLLRELLREISPEIEQDFRALSIWKTLSHERGLTVMPFRLTIK